MAWQNWYSLQVDDLKEGSREDTGNNHNYRASIIKRIHVMFLKNEEIKTTSQRVTWELQLLQTKGKQARRERQKDQTEQEG